MSNQITYDSKEFLNKDGRQELSAIGCSFSLDDNYCDGYIKITDCRRVVNLDMLIYTQDDYENSLHKIEVLKRHLNSLELFLIVNKDRILKVCEKRENKEKEGGHE